MFSGKRIEISEKSVASMWQQLLGKELAVEGCERLRVIYPGRINGDSGPDFRDAVVAMGESGLVKGDVEIHIKSSDWYSHGHHDDPRYSNVILHTVLWHDGKEASLRQNSKIPMLCLSKVLKCQPYLLPYTLLPCCHILERMDRQTLWHLLNIAGRERFEQKAALFQLDLEREEAGQVVFQGIMRALGYSKNSQPFVELAHRVPLSFLEKWEQRESLVWKQAWLSGMAGMLPSQRLRDFSCDKRVQELEQIWQWSAKGARTMRESDWCFSCVYPNNSPLRRIIAQAYLLQRYSEEGLLPGVSRLVRETLLAGGYRRLEEGLFVSGDDYWQEHCDFGSKTGKAALLGHGKASEIVVNIILPFIFSWGGRAGDSDLQEKALQLYLSYPRLAENEITRHMIRQICLEERSDFTACQQQGLIHIFRNWCKDGRCGECPLAYK